MLAHMWCHFHMVVLQLIDALSCHKAHRGQGFNATASSRNLTSAHPSAHTPKFSVPVKL